MRRGLGALAAIPILFNCDMLAFPVKTLGKLSFLLWGKLNLRFGESPVIAV
jgi:hypothetical protein